MTPLALIASLLAAVPVLPEASAALASRESRVPVSLRFENETSQDAALFWLDFRGERKDYGTLAPHSARTVRTWLTHPWVATDAAGRVLGTFLPVEGEGVARIYPRLHAGDPDAAVRSRDSTQAAAIHFVNRTGALVHLSWIDPDGKRELRGRVRPGESLRLRTFAAHAWVATDENGKAFATFVATPGETTAIVEPRVQR